MHLAQILVLILLVFKSTSFCQTQLEFNLSDSKNISSELILDGILNESSWADVPSTCHLKMIEPTEGAECTFSTTIKIFADSKNIVLGIQCFDDLPSGIVAFSKARDSELENEDYIKFVFDTYLDGRNGYIFAINPFGARYDALVSGHGENENPSWDGVWEAETNIDSLGWSAEIKIPIHGLSFGNNLSEWGFNIERRIQRLLEVDRWTAINSDYQIGQVSQAGRVKNLPDFNYGLGTTVKISGISDYQKTYSQNHKLKFDGGLDVIQKITSGISALLTINTDFAETEVDTRKTNLTRFPLLFEEKRSFFLEGSDVYDFGLGLDEDLIPFFSRRIGLFDGQAIPIVAGGKVNGKLNNTNFGAVVTRTDALEGIVPASTMGAFRVKQNVFEESNFGIIGTFGDPQNLANRWMMGIDFTYNTSQFLGDKNFLVGVWGLLNNNEKMEGDKTAIGIKIDYPNDTWDIALVYKRIGDAFDPSLGFVPRKGINKYRLAVEYMPRPEWQLVRQFFFEFEIELFTSLNNTWESYNIFTAPINLLLESGDQFEFNINPQGEKLSESFEVEDNILIPIGEYTWNRYGLVFESANKRSIGCDISWWFGGFYEGHLDEIELELYWRPNSNLILEFNFEKNIAKLAQGDFIQDLYGCRVLFNYSSDLQLSSFFQYDNDSRELGTNSKIRWTFAPQGDLFVVYNHNVNNFIKDRWQFDSNQFILKISYGLWL
ncbi:MAG: carbohydrate binding family 9 domain-containing protein [Bacteroidetes bacterium]|nr:carbohydrate binding family 9 domain-containing protein [Bacteroidota bacterium]